jgi:hypothetical protein
VAISETGRQSLLNHLSSDLDFEWFSCPPGGISDGILLGIQANTMEILHSSDGEYHIELDICNKSHNFTWSLVVIYGIAQDEFKDVFLRELVNLAKGFLFSCPRVLSCTQFSPAP